MNNASILNPSIPIIEPFILKGKFTLKVLWVLAFFVMLSLLIFCVFQLNARAQEIYLIQNYEEKIEQLVQENKILEINFSKANSLNNIGNYVQNFEKADKVEYIRVLESTVVAK